MDEDILIKFSGDSNLQERANKINDKIISAIEFNKMTFRKGEKYSFHLYYKMYSQEQDWG